MEVEPKSTGEVIRLTVSGMDCANCAKTIERGVATLQGVDSVHVSYPTERLEASGSATADAIADKVRQLGFGIAHSPDEQRSHMAASGSNSFMQYLWSEWQTRSALIAATVILAVSLGNLLMLSGASELLQIALIAAVLLVGVPIAIKGVRALLFARQITIDLLMALAATGALFIGAYGEAAAVML